MSYGGMGYVDAVKDLASMAGMQVPEAQPRSPEQAQRDSERKAQETSLAEVMERAMEFYRAELKKSPRAIEYLKGRGLTGEIAARFACSWPTTTRHLRQLELAGLVVVERRGRARMYSLNQARLTRVVSGWLAHFGR